MSEPFFQRPMMTKCVFEQDEDTATTRSNHVSQQIEVETNVGNGIDEAYYAITTTRWAFNDIKELVALLKQAGCVWDHEQRATEALLLEVRELRKPKETKKVAPAAKPSLSWNSYVDVPLITSAVHDRMDEIARQIMRVREAQLVKDFWAGVPMTNNVDPAEPQTMGGARLIEPKGKTG